jgi:hypothetical protein
MKSKYMIIGFLFLLLGFNLITSIEATPICSFSYSVKGCNIYLNPTLSDVAWYQWRIEPGDGTTILGNTSWIPSSSIFTQMFSMDHIGEYRVTLQARNSTGATAQYSRIISTMGSSQSIMIPVSVQPPTVNMSFTDRFVSWFNSFPPLAQTVLVIIGIFLAAVSIDVVFHVSRDREKKGFYKTEELKR